MLYAAAEAGKFGRVVVYVHEALLGIDNIVYSYIVVFAIPWIDVAGVFQYGVQMADAEFTEAVFQADGGLAVTPTAVIADDGCILFQLPNGFHTVAEVFLTFEIDFRTDVGNFGTGFRLLQLCRLRNILSEKFLRLLSLCRTR